MSKLQQLTSRYFSSDTPDLSTLEKATDLMFVNVNEVLDGAESFPPNVIRVGGLQIPKARQLSRELANFIESGEKGEEMLVFMKKF